jgi:peroxiredoxin
MSIATSAPRIGQLLPAIRLPSLDGHDVDFSEFRGKRMLIFMWASW